MKPKSSRMIFFFAVMFVFNMAANFVHPVTPAIIVDLQLNDYMFGLALAAMMTFNFLFSPFWGKMAGFFSSRKVILLSGVCYAIGQLFFGVARTEFQFLLARMFSGIFVGGCYVSFLTYTVNCSTPENRGRNLAINATVIAVSSSFGYFIGAILGDEEGKKYSIDLYRALDMALPGLLAFRSILDHGMPYAVPDLRDHRVRDAYRSDHYATDPRTPAEYRLDTSKTGTPEVEEEVYRTVQKEFAMQNLKPGMN